MEANGESDEIPNDLREIMQAAEALKLLLGIGDTMVGRLMLFDALESKFRELRLRRNPQCPACGENSTLSQVTDLEYACAVPVA